MAWSYVFRGKKPLAWWWYKILAELGWSVRGLIKSDRMYYTNLDKMVRRCRINLYGQRIIR
jgi:hypothetical protein